MRAPIYSGQFRRDMKTARQRGKDMGKLKEPMRLPVGGKTLPVRYGDHPLKG